MQKTDAAKAKKGVQVVLLANTAMLIESNDDIDCVYDSRPNGSFSKPSTILKKSSRDITTEITV